MTDSLRIFRRQDTVERTTYFYLQQRQELGMDRSAEYTWALRRMISMQTSKYGGHPRAALGISYVCGSFIWLLSIDLSFIYIVHEHQLSLNPHCDRGRPTSRKSSSSASRIFCRSRGQAQQVCALRRSGTQWISDRLFIALIHTRTGPCMHLFLFYFCLRANFKPV